MNGVTSVYMCGSVYVFRSVESGVCVSVCLYVVSDPRPHYVLEEPQTQLEANCRTTQTSLLVATTPLRLQQPS